MSKMTCNEVSKTIKAANRESVETFHITFDGKKSQPEDVQNERNGELDPFQMVY